MKTMAIATTIALSSAAVCFGGEASRLVENLKAGKPQTLVTYGTSLTDGAAWVAALQQKLEAEFPGKAKVINSARSAMWSGWGVQNFAERVIAKQPDMVMIEFSINDAYLPYKTSVAQARSNLVGMVEQILQARPACEVVLMVMNPTIAEHLERRPQLPEYNEMVREVARERKLLLIDHYPRWEKIQREQPELFRRYIPDGLHPAPEGCDKVITPGIFAALGLN